jgi:hypothetical protein
MLQTIRSIAVHFFLGLSQVRVFRLGRDEYWNVRIGVFPKREEIFVGGESTDASGIGIGAYIQNSAMR